MLFFESLLDGLLGFLARFGFLKGFGRDGQLERFDVQGVSGGHQVVVVDDLDEGLDLGSLGGLLGTHVLGDLEGGLVDTDDDGVGEGVGLSPFVVGLDDDDLLTGVSATGDNSYN